MLEVVAGMAQNVAMPEKAQDSDVALSKEGRSLIKAGTKMVRSAAKGSDGDSDRKIGLALQAKGTKMMGV